MLIWIMVQHNGSWEQFLKIATYIFPDSANSGADLSTGQT